MRTSIVWLRRTAFALIGMLALSVVAAIGPATEASAAPYMSKLCWLDWSNGQLKVYCVDIEVVWPWDKYTECWMCGLSFDWQHDPVIREDLEAAVGQQVVNGIDKLGAAEFTRDVTLRAQLRAEAMSAFTAAARYGGGSAMSMQSTGVANMERNTYEPDPHPWTLAAGADIVDGVALLQRSFEDPVNAGRLRALAAAQFDEAYTELSQQRVIEG